MKTLILLIVIAVSTTAFAQKTAYFNNNADKVLISSILFNEETKTWIGHFQLFENIAGEGKLILNETYKSNQESDINADLNEIISENDLDDQAVNQSSEVSDLNFSYKVSKKRKIGTPEGMHARRYVIRYELSLQNQELDSDRMDFHQWATNKEASEIKKSDLLNALVWVHPQTGKKFLDVDVQSQPLVMEFYRYTYIDNKSHKRFNRFI